MGGAGVILSKRLKMLADMVTCGNRVADIGCDHGFLSIYLVQAGVCPKALAMDVRKGPLRSAESNIEARGMRDYIETRLSDGLGACRPGEVDTVVCAGMGGSLMERILSSDMDKVRQMKELILQPQSELPNFRAFLRREGLKVVQEAAVYEEGKYYFAMKAVPAGHDGRFCGREKRAAGELPAGGYAKGRQENEIRSENADCHLYDLYGRQLLLEKNPVLCRFLSQRQSQAQALAEALRGASSERAGQRLLEVEKELLDIRKALEYFNRGKHKGQEVSMLTVTIQGQNEEEIRRQVEPGTTYEAIAEEYQEACEGTIAVAVVNGKIRELFKRVTKDCTVRFFTLRDDVGHKTYVRTATMLFIKAVYDVFGPDAAQGSCVEFAVGHGTYVNMEGHVEATWENAEKLKTRMGQLVEAKAPFMKKSYPLEEAVELFRERGMEDKVKLFRYRMSSSVNVYEIDGFCDYYYGYMLPNAGYVKWFDLVPYGAGFMLVLPEKSAPGKVEPYRESRKLFETMESAKKWGRTAGIETVGDLNDQICSGSMSDVILAQEAQQERKIGEIAKDIAAREDVKFVMIAGPSSSGKTSFSHRLSIQLRTLGKVPRTIALDNYFVNRELTPRDEKGDYNFECLEAIDVKLFNENMVSLLAGERVEIPSFNFKTGQREYRGDFMQLGENDILVLEGIHGLNEKMSYALPEESKYKIYISALMTLNIDKHNRIPTTDCRLLRRMIRDARTRGASAQRTIQMWHSVRRGEEQNIFPFQEEADAMFNSSLIYELAMLKTFAEPLLFQIPKEAPEYYEAKRLLKFLNYFLSVPSESLPNNSICREFVGGSCFNV